MTSKKIIDPWSPTSSCFDNEAIGVLAIYPRHFDGVPVDLLSIFSKTQLKKGCLSSARLSWTTPIEVWREVIEKAKPASDGRYVTALGIIIGLYSTYKSIQFSSGEQAFQVIPSGSETNRSHADIKFLKSDKIDHNIENITRMRASLLDLLLTTDTNGSPQYLVQLPMCCSLINSFNASHPVVNLDGI